jgi:RNA polymerase sigma-70 factor, ECF subfamily
MLDGEEYLVKAAIRGESSAFGALYDEYQPRIYRFILLKVGHREEAEDLTHQVFLNAWTNIEKYRHRGHPFSSWLYRIARNQVIDHYRVRKSDVTLDEELVEELTEIVQVSENVEMKLRMEEVFLAIRELRSDYQDVILMRFVEDLPLKDIANTLEKSEGAVKLMQHRAMQELREKLRNDHNDDDSNGHN